MRRQLLSSVFLMRLETTGRWKSWGPMRCIECSLTYLSSKALTLYLLKIDFFHLLQRSRVSKSQFPRSRHRELRIRMPRLQVVNFSSTSVGWGNSLAVDCSFMMSESDIPSFVMFTLWCAVFSAWSSPRYYRKHQTVFVRIGIKASCGIRCWTWSVNCKRSIGKRVGNWRSLLGWFGDLVSIKQSESGLTFFSVVTHGASLFFKQPWTKAKIFDDGFF